MGGKYGFEALAGVRRSGILDDLSQDGVRDRSGGYGIMLSDPKGRPGGWLLMFVPGRDIGSMGYEPGAFRPPCAVPGRGGAGLNDLCE